MLIKQEIPRHDLFLGIGRERIDARRIRNQCFRMLPHMPALAGNGNARKVPYMLIGSRQLIEQRRLPAVLIADQGEGKRLALRNCLRLVMMVPARRPIHLANAGMRNGKMHFILRCRMILRAMLMLLMNGHQSCFVPPQRELITAYQDLNRITHRRTLHEFDLSAGSQPHVQQMMPKRSLPFYDVNIGSLARLQLIKLHRFAPLY